MPREEVPTLEPLLQLQQMEPLMSEQAVLIVNECSHWRICCSWDGLQMVDWGSMYPPQ